MGQKHEPDADVRTHLMLKGRHRNWADDKNISLSAEVRDMLDDRIDGGGA